MPEGHSKDKRLCRADLTGEVVGRLNDKKFKDFDATHGLWIGKDNKKSTQGKTQALACYTESLEWMAGFDITVERQGKVLQADTRPNVWPD